MSDGIQTQITELYPEAIFLPIETSGDGKVNFESRMMMMLFKAKQAALKESEAALARTGLTREKVREKLKATPSPVIHCSSCRTIAGALPPMPSSLPMT